ncbi:MAG: hypothetical protein WB629_01560 [Candidatus Sulfotelmatobacter sp.]
MENRLRSVGEEDIPGKPPLFTPIGAFLFFGAAMASLAGITLIWRGTILYRVWVLNPRAWQQLAPSGKLVGISFLILATVLALAGVGWFRRQLWGWRLCVAIIATQVLGDLVNCLRGDFLRGGVGFAIGGALLIYLLRPKIRAYFRRKNGILT